MFIPVIRFYIFSNLMKSGNIAFIRIQPELIFGMVASKIFHLKPQLPLVSCVNYQKIQSLGTLCLNDLLFVKAIVVIIFNNLPIIREFKGQFFRTVTLGKNLHNYLSFFA